MKTTANNNQYTHIERLNNGTLKVYLLDKRGNIYVAEWQPIEGIWRSREFTSLNMEGAVMKAKELFNITVEKSAPQRLYINPYNEEVKETAKAWNKHARHQKSSLFLSQENVAVLMRRGYTSAEILAANTKTKLMRLCKVYSANV